MHEQRRIRRQEGENQQRARESPDLRRQAKHRPFRQGSSRTSTVRAPYRLTRHNGDERQSKQRVNGEIPDESAPEHSRGRGREHDGIQKADDHRSILLQPPSDRILEERDHRDRRQAENGNGERVAVRQQLCARVGDVSAVGR